MAKIIDSEKEINLEKLCGGFKTLRLNSKINQIELSEYTGVSQPIISSLEQGGGFNIKTFISLYNFYIKTMSEEKVLKTLFNASSEGNYLIKLKIESLKKEQDKLFNKLIKDLE